MKSSSSMTTDKKNRRGPRWALLALALLVLANAAPARAQDDEAERAAHEAVERDALNVADYEKLTIVVLEMEPNPAKVTQEAVKYHVESRLKAAELKPQSAESDHFLFVFVHVDGGAFNIDLGFYRAASWVLPGGRTGNNFLETWNSGHTLGTHGNNGAYILKELDTRIDQFLKAYLRANQKAK
jgi:hypothetical protein